MPARGGRAAALTAQPPAPASPTLPFPSGRLRGRATASIISRSVPLPAGACPLFFATVHRRQAAQGLPATLFAVSGQRGNVAPGWVRRLPLPPAVAHPPAQQTHFLAPVSRSCSCFLFSPSPPLRARHRCARSVFISPLLCIGRSPSSTHLAVADHLIRCQVPHADVARVGRCRLESRLSEAAEVVGRRAAGFRPSQLWTHDWQT